MELIEVWIPEVKAAESSRSTTDNVNENLRDHTKRFVWANAKHTDDPDNNGNSKWDKS